VALRVEARAPGEIVARQSGEARDGRAGTRLRWADGTRGPLAEVAGFDDGTVRIDCLVPCTWSWNTRSGLLLVAFPEAGATPSELAPVAPGDTPFALPAWGWTRALRDGPDGWWLAIHDVGTPPYGPWQRDPESGLGDATCPGLLRPHGWPAGGLVIAANRGDRPWGIAASLVDVGEGSLHGEAILPFRFTLDTRRLRVAAQPLVTLRKADDGDTIIVPSQSYRNC